jgi:hypothetical protein
MTKNKIKKIISFLLLFLMIVPTVLFSTPQKTHADEEADSTDTPLVIDQLTAQGVEAATAAAAEAACGVSVFGNSDFGCPIAAFNAYIAATSADQIIVNQTEAIKNNPPAKNWIQKANDWLNTTEATSSAYSNLQNLAINIKNVAKEVLRQALIVLGHKLLDTMTQSTVNWINSGFHGSPLFVQNPDQFFGNIGQSEIKSIINMVGYDPNQPFGQQFALNLINQYKQSSLNDMQYSLSKVVNDPALLNNYRTNFNYGGWNAFLINTQYPQNNYIGYNMKMNETLAQRLAGNTSTQNTIQKVQTLLKQGNGFLSPTTCPPNIPNAAAYNAKMTNEFNPPTFHIDTSSLPPMPDCNESGQGATPDVSVCVTNGVVNETCVNLIEEGANADKDQLCTEEQAAVTAAANKQQTDFNKTSACLDANGKSALVATTPGAVAADHIMNALNLKTGVAGLDTALGNSMSSILNAFMNHFLSEGLTGLSNAITGASSTADTWSYQGQTLTSSGSTSASTLTIPTNVSLSVGNVTSNTISGGTAPYSIQKQPDTKVATVQISGANITVTGIGQGTTSTIIQDSSSITTTSVPTTQVNTITLGGVTGTAGTLNVTINSVLTSVPVTRSDTTITAATSLANAIDANTKINNSILATITTPGVVTITSKTPGTAGVFSLTSTNTTTLLTATSAVATSASDSNASSTNQIATITITVSKNGTLAIDFTNTNNNPASISVGVGNSMNLTLSGGIQPYSIQTTPDPTITIAQINDNTLTIIGVAAGTTATPMVLQDSAGQTVSLNITVGIETPLSATPQNISGTGNGSSNTTTISGGTAPYTIVKQPDPGSASALISGNTLTIIGVAGGNTSVTIQDSFSPAETLTIPITITGSGTTTPTITGATLTQ